MFLLREEVTLDSALKPGSEPTAVRVPAIANEEILIIAARPPHAPSWSRYLEPHVDGNLDELRTASSSAVLLVQASGRVFAVAFGQGRHLLDPEAYEPDFGLKVVLNTVAPDQLKSVDAKTIDETTLHTRRDASRDSRLTAFGLDITRDLLRAVTGTPRDDALANRLTGSDALGLWTRAQLPELPAVMDKLLVAYQSDDYKQNFDFVDHLRPEKRAAKLRELEQALVDALNARDIDDAHMAAPEVLDPLDLEGFRFSTTPGADLVPDPRISSYLDSRSGELIAIERLKSDRLLAVRSDGDAFQDWSVYRSIVYEVASEGDLYVLTGGDWFRINLDFKQRVYDELSAITRREDLPPADAGTDEDAYNLKAAAALGALCLDQKLVFDGGPDRMEICDILTLEKGLIHVKQRGASSTLSHLFAQGVNCAERLLQDGEFRRQARAVAEREDTAFGEVLPEERPADPSEYEVTFAVITRSDRDTPLTLPFFSLVSLRAAVNRLRAYGFRVSLAEVHEMES